MSDTFHFVCPNCRRGHDFPAVLCTLTTLPTCACGGVLDLQLDSSAGDRLRCPNCRYRPDFMERPVWQHIGVTVFNLAGITKLELTRENEDE